MMSTTSLMDKALACHAILKRLARDLLYPSVQVRSAETPQLSDVNAHDFTVTSHFLEGLGMNPEQTCSFVTVQQRLEQGVGLDLLFGWSAVCAVHKNSEIPVWLEAAWAEHGVRIGCSQAGSS